MTKQDQKMKGQNFLSLTAFPGCVSCLIEELQYILIKLTTMKMFK